MIRLMRTVSVVTLLALVAAPAFAQVRRTQSARVPNRSMFGLGMSTGLYAPSSIDQNNGWYLTANGEGYFTPRVSARAQFGGGWSDIFGHSFAGTVKPMVLLGNLVYNWEGGKIHPYVTGGGGMYHYRFTEAGVDSSNTKAGVDFGGGAEYFFTRHDTLTGEVLFHAVPGMAQGHNADYKARFWTITGGYKKYF
jgi:hypothetical protein